MGVPIHVQLFVGPKLTFYIQLTDTIKDLKAKIQDERGLPPERQCLKFNDQILEEGKTLHDYSIQENSKLFLIELGTR